MAYQSLAFSIGTLKAGEDLSNRQFRCVVPGTAADTVKLNTTAGGSVTGVLQNDPTSGDVATIGAVGITKIVAGGTVAYGDRWASDNEGRAVVATTGAFSPGEVLEGGSAGEIIAVTIGINPRTV